MAQTDISGPFVVAGQTIVDGDGNIVGDIEVGNLEEIVDSNGNVLLEFGETASAVNYLRITNSATGNGADLSSQGSDSNVDLVFTPKGTGEILVDQDDDGVSLHIDSEATTAASYGLHIEMLDSGNGAQAARLERGSNRAEFLRANDNSNGSNFFYRNLDSGSTAGPVVNIENDNSSDDQTTLRLQQDGTGSGLAIDHNGATGAAVNIDRDSNDAGDVYAVTISSDNSGAGNPGGIDLSSFALDEPNFKFRADAISTAGTVSQQIAIDIGGTTYYLVAYTHGS